MSNKIERLVNDFCKSNENDFVDNKKFLLDDLLIILNEYEDISAGLRNQLEFNKDILFDFTKENKCRDDICLELLKGIKKNSFKFNAYEDGILNIIDKSINYLENEVKILEKSISDNVN